MPGRNTEIYKSPISLDNGTKERDHRVPRQRTAIDHVKKLVTTLDKVKLLATGPPAIPWKRKPTLGTVKAAVKYGIIRLPLFYQEAYVRPFLDNLPTILEQAGEELEILAGAIYCHKPPRNNSVTKRSRNISNAKRFHKSLKGFLAVISNTYRSFLGKRRREMAHFPPVEQYPPLAMFKHRSDVSQNQVAPFIRTREVVERITGGKVGIVGLPSAYRDHPLLWGAIAHEVGGHEILTSDKELLPELQAEVRALFDTGPVPSGDLTLPELQGLLWQYWAEEAASDVCGVLNMGPTYGFSLAVYHAALTRRISNWYRRREGPSSSRSSTDSEPLLRNWSGNRIIREHFSGPLDPEVLALLKTRDLDDLDPHPVDILKLHVVIGAIDNLSHLTETIRKDYVEKLIELSTICTGGQTNIDVAGYIQTGPDTWMRVDTGSLPLKAMQMSARRVGAHIATAKWNALHGHSLQELETWDDGDEAVANEIAGIFDDCFQDDLDPDIDDFGDDAQLLAGSYLAFHRRPDCYDEISQCLLNALETSFQRDEVWGVTPLHFIFKWNPRANPRGPRYSQKAKPRVEDGSRAKRRMPDLNYRNRIVW